MWIPQKISIIIHHKFYKKKKVRVRKEKERGEINKKSRKQKQTKEIADLHAGERTATRTKQERKLQHHTSQRNIKMDDTK